jgi:hypothetical protein
MNLVLDLPEAPNPEALIVAKPDIAKPAVIEPQVPGTTEAFKAAAEIESTAPIAVGHTQPPELELVDQIWASWRNQIAAGLEQSIAAAELEAARKKYETAQEQLATHKAKTAELLESFLPRLAEIRDPSAVAMVEQIQSQSAEHPSPAAEQPGTQMNYYEWLKIPTAEVLEGIEGLGPKKVSALVEKFPTVEQLETARTDAGKAHLHFCKMLVKGIGEQTADRIEAAMSDLLMGQKARKLAATPAASTSQTPTAEPNPEPDQESEIPSDPESQIADVERIAKESGIEIGIEIDEPEDKPSDDDDSPWVNPNADDAIYEDVDDSPEPDSPEDSPEAAGGESSSDETSWAEAFGIKVLTDPEHVKTNWGSLGKNQSQPWKLGNKAYGEGKVCEACPFSYEDDLDSAKDWVLGWTAASMSDLDL